MSPEVVDCITEHIAPASGEWVALDRPRGDIHRARDETFAGMPVPQTAAEVLRIWADNEPTPFVVRVAGGRVPARVRVHVEHHRDRRVTERTFETYGPIGGLPPGSDADIQRALDFKDIAFAPRRLCEAVAATIP